MTFPEHVTDAAIGCAGAFGIAGGIRCHFGTMTRPLHLVQLSSRSDSRRPSRANGIDRRRHG